MLYAGTAWSYIYSCICRLPGTSTVGFTLTAFYTRQNVAVKHAHDIVDGYRSSQIKATLLLMPINLLLANASTNYACLISRSDRYECNLVNIFLLLILNLVYGRMPGNPESNRGRLSTRISRASCLFAWIHSIRFKSMRSCIIQEDYLCWLPVELCQLKIRTVSHGLGRIHAVRIKKGAQYIEYENMMQVLIHKSVHQALRPVTSP